MSERYNGWTNYETWATHLWLDNDEGMQRECMRMCSRAISEYEGGRELRRLVEESAPDLPASLYADLLSAALREVNWSEIAKAFTDDENCVDEAPDEDDEESNDAL